jgi:hypothetical protein
MSFETIIIKNKLEILPGNVIRLPGCEPVTSFTSLALAANVDCKASVIALEDAILAIREVAGEDPCIEKVHQPAGVPGTGKFLVLPSGPPPDPACPCVFTEDWYQILRDAAEPIDFDAVRDPEIEGCDGFNYSGCRQHTADNQLPRRDLFNLYLSEVANLHKAPDPELRPNSKPLGGVFS